MGCDQEASAEHDGPDGPRAGQRGRGALWALAIWESVVATQIDRARGRAEQLSCWEPAKLWCLPELLDLTDPSPTSMTSAMSHYLAELWAADPTSAAFVGLDDVKWGALEHAHGPASDVPLLLRDLADPTTEKDGLEGLYDTVLHQGSRYSASPQVAPFLVQLLEADGSRSIAITLMTQLVAGFFGISSPGAWCDGVEVHWGDGSVVPLDEDVEADLSIWVACWQQASEALPLWLRLLHHESSDTRSATAVLLALMGTLPGVSAALRGRLAEEPEPAVRADVVFALSRIGDEGEAGWEDPSPVVQLVTAASHVGDPRAVPILAAHLGGDVDVSGVHALGTADGGFLVAWGLAQSEASQLRPLIPRLLEGLATDPRNRAQWARASLRAMGPVEAGKPTPVQRQVLMALVEDAAVWTAGWLREDFAAAGVPQERVVVKEELLGIPRESGPGIEHIDRAMKTRDAEERLRCFDQATPEDFDRHPDRFQAWRRYTIDVWADADRWDHAAKVWAAYIERFGAPGLVGVLDPIVRLFGPEAQLAAFRAALDADPDCTVLWYKFGLKLRYLDRYEEALEPTERALALNPKHREAMWNRASLLSLLGRVEPALLQIEQCMKAYPWMGRDLWRDKDFDAIREQPRFRAAVGQVE